MCWDLQIALVEPSPRVANMRCIPGKVRALRKNLGNSGKPLRYTNKIYIYNLIIKNSSLVYSQAYRKEASYIKYYFMMSFGDLCI